MFRSLSNLLLLFLTVLLLGCTRSPEAIFRAVFDERPQSLVLIEGQDQYILDCCLWLHFKIGREDLKRILSKGFTSDEIDYTKWDHVGPQLDWWTPEVLEKTGRYFERVSEDGRVIESIYTTDTFDEVYYVNFFN